MPRISKNDVNKALSTAGKNIKDAAGKDKVSSRKDVKNTLSTLSGTEKALTERFFQFIDHRDAKLGARVTENDVEKALAYAKDHLVAKYDLNGNGLSKA